MGMAMIVQMLVGVRMLVVVCVGMTVLMGVRYTVMGVLMRVGVRMFVVMVMVMMTMLVIDMHNIYLVSFSIFCADIINGIQPYVKTFIFRKYPPGALAQKGDQ